MILKITDNRTTNEKQLFQLWPSDFFLWGDELYRRIEANTDADIRYQGEGIPAVHQRSGDLTIIDREAWVVPCSCEMTIEE